MSCESYWRENIAWLSRSADEGWCRIGWTTGTLGWWEFPIIQRTVREDHLVGQVSPDIVIFMTKDIVEFERLLYQLSGHRGWPIEIQRMAPPPPPPKKVDYSRITREIVGDLR